MHKIHARLKRTFLCILSFTFSFVLSAQDLHFSQFYHSPQNLNPALIGQFRGDCRATGNLRSQWSAVPVPYQTFGGGGDAKILRGVFGSGLISGGLQFNYDQAGDLAFKMTELNLGASFALPLSDQATASFGLAFGFANRNLDPTLMTTAAQFNGDQFDENLSTGEDIPDPRADFARLATGVNLHWLPDARSRTTVDMGAGFFNLNYPNTSLKNNANAARIPLRLSLYADGWVQINEKTDIKGHALWHIQGDFNSGTYRELLTGTGIRYHLNLEPDKEKSVALLTSYRWGDALIPSVEVGWRFLTAAFSYDFNTSPFQVATARRGGPEFALIYIFTKPTPPPVFKACPVF